jgi:hypothetical protein
VVRELGTVIKQVRLRRAMEPATAKSCLQTKSNRLTSVRKPTNETVQGGPYRWYTTNTGPCTVGCAVAMVQYGTVVQYYINQWKIA